MRQRQGVHLVRAVVPSSVRRSRGTISTAIRECMTAMVENS
ncbi:hypothetical protein [Streptomyces lydicus]|nr:hypothetical protein [Streptomyces lydicus]